MAMDSNDKLENLQKWTKKFNKDLQKLRFDEPVAYVYNPLEYAGDVYFEYWRRFASSPKKLVFLGMNPGPFGMAQNGIPFGEISMVRDWMKLNGNIKKPQREHPKRPVEGFDCQKSEVSGRRLWGYFSEVYPNAQDFFNKHFVLNYCPLVFMSESGANITPDKLKSHEREALESLCDDYLAKCLAILNPERCVGVGGFAFDCLNRLAKQKSLEFDVKKILHPSPASPAANKDWAGQVRRSLQKDGVTL